MCYCFLFGLLLKSTVLQYQQCFKALCQIFQCFFMIVKQTKKKNSRMYIVVLYQRKNIRSP